MGSSALRTSAAEVRAATVRPAIGDRVELAVAVELVAEQVGQQQRARLQLVDDLAEPELVDLEQAGVAVARAVHERGGHAAGHVRAGAVVDQPRAGALEDAGHHRRGRRLAVGGRDHGAAALQAGAQARDGVGLQAHEQLARQRRAAAAGPARQRAGGARGRDLDVEGRHARQQDLQRAREGAEGHRQLADRVAVGVDDERPVGVDAHLGAAQHVHAGLVDVLALEHLGQHAAQEAHLARAFEPDDVEGPVVELGVGGDEHAAAVGLGVGHRDAPAGEADPLAVDLEGELRRLPGRQRAQGAVDVDELAEPRRRLVGDPVGLGVEAQRRDPDERVVARQAEIDRARRAVGDHVARGLGVERDAGHAREVVAAPAGQDADDRARDVAQRTGDGAEHPVAAERDHHAPALRRADGELARRGRGRAWRRPRRRRPRASRRASTAGSALRGAAAAGGGVDDQGDVACHVAAHLDHPDSRMKVSTSSGLSVIT